jgi:polar amino acid transport system substrate-binding protein
VLVVGTDAAYAPFESQNEKGEIVGFDIDIVKAVAQKAGLEVKFVNTPWEGIFNALKQGDRDLLVSSITITDERKQTMDFTAPYFDAHQLIAVRADSKVARFDDLKTLKVGVQTGTTGDEAISKLQGKTSPNVKRFERHAARALGARHRAGSTRSSPTTASSSTTSRTTAAASSAPSTTRRSRPSSTASR